MAQFPSLDLLTEVDELAMCAEGKGVENSFHFLFHDDSLDCSLSDRPATDGMFLDDSMLAVDSSSNVLLGDPLFNLSDPNELHFLQPPNLGSNPETLIPVSLPADSTTTTTDPTTTTSQLAGSQPEEEEEDPLELDPPNSRHDVSKATPESDHSTYVTSNGSEGGRSGTVRIIVNTSANSPDEMVAPAILPNPSHNLVKIPKGSLCSQAIRVKRTVSSGGRNDAAKAEQLVRPRARAHPCNRQQRVVGSVRKISETTSESGDALLPRSPVSSESLAMDSSPFWSLRSRRPSVSSVASESGTKRKAYELEPLSDPQMERCRKNALNAKKNREMKKAHVTHLERKVLDVSRERDQLAGENESLREANVRLEEQVKHLRNLLENQSPLAALIGKLSPASVVLGEAPTGEDDDKIISSASGR
ncbi:uncharacterized protein LOC135195716 isoform X2 [Macrobrachium nipponense]|uniref:uncharacterized protein LOC135195716 isoform X2 n=1 Tax=Macrobrachium nipponense TaxID=159736 RepID=UPI0030C8C108